jgi:peptide/nickel transport system permease protein
MRRIMGWAVPSALVAIPVLLALLGPLLASNDTTKDMAFTLGGGHWLGTDHVGRDVWAEVLRGGLSLVLVAVTATAVTYLLAVPVGMAAGLTRDRRVDEALMRPLDVLLAVPSMMLLLLLASVAPGLPWVLVAVVVLVNLPDVVRITRTSALALAARPALDAMRLQGESRTRILWGYALPAMRRTLAADVGIRFTGAIYLVASASFLGVGVAPQASDWAAMVDRNRAGLFVQPLAVVAPAVLIVMLCVGVNLLFDRWLRGQGIRPTVEETP